MDNESDKAGAVELVAAAGQAATNADILAENRNLANEVLVYKTGMYVGIGLAGILGATLLVTRMLQNQRIAEAQLRTYQQTPAQPQGYGYQGYGYPGYGYGYPAYR